VSRIKRGLLRSKALGATTALIIAAFLAHWAWRGGAGPENPGAVASPDAGRAGIAEFHAQTLRQPLILQEPPGRPGYIAPLSPEEAIGNPACRMTMGVGAAASLAAVAVQGSSETRFSVLDSTGALFSDVLPFRSHRSRLGMSRNGTVVAGFGGMHLNPAWSQFYDEKEPLRIYVDGQVAYENDDIWLFDVADNGGSYFFIEPLGTEFSSRLVIASLEDGTLAEHDLGKLFRVPSRRVPYQAAFTQDGEEVHLKPDHFDFSEGVGSHYFFPVAGGGNGRKITVPNTGHDDRAYFLSSEEGYFFHGGIEGISGFRVVKKKFDWDKRTASSEWELEAPASMRATLFDSSPDGEWILFATGTSSSVSRPAMAADWMLFVVDTNTGQPVFEFPTDDAALQLSRLASVLPPQATEEDAGIFRAAFFVGNEKFALQHYPETPESTDMRNSVLDIFDMGSIGLDSQPSRRVAINRHAMNDCASENFPYRLEADRRGALAYSPVEPD